MTLRRLAPLLVRGRATACGYLSAALLVPVLLAGSQAAAAARTPRQLLESAVRGSRSIAYTGELMSVSWEDGLTVATTYAVEQPRNAGLVVRPLVGDQPDGGDPVVASAARLAPLPAAADRDPAELVTALLDKYRARVTGHDALLDRAVTRVEILRRDDDRLAERWWLDDDTGLVLRRESFGGGEEPVRLSSWLSLELARSRRPAAAARAEGPEPVDGRSLAALRAAGWAVPPTLPGRYAAEGVFAADDGADVPLQVLYTDGLYGVSLFEDRGRLDPGALPAGGVLDERLGWPAWSFPGQVPRRLVWEADGTTYTLVGDAPADEMDALAQALPQPSADGLPARLGRGLGRLWSLVSPW